MLEKIALALSNIQRPLRPVSAVSSLVTEASSGTFEHLRTTASKVSIKFKSFACLE